MIKNALPMRAKHYEHSRKNSRPSQWSLTLGLDRCPRSGQIGTISAPTTGRLRITQFGLASNCHLLPLGTNRNPGPNLPVMTVDLTSRLELTF
jgi:hypothetical protein